MALGEDKRIMDRTDYMNATGYDVGLLVTYRRVRKVRALDKAQAAEFAVAREEEYAARYFNASSHIDYEIVNVEPISVTESAERIQRQKASGKP